MKKIGIIGGGAMGSGIAQVFAQSGHSVVLYDTNKEALDRSKQNLAKTFEKLVAKEKYTAEKAQEIQNKIEYADSLTAFASIDLMIEAIIENLDIKKSVFKQVEEIVSDECILASNTSSFINCINCICVFKTRTCNRNSLFQSSTINGFGRNYSSCANTRRISRRSKSINSICW